MTEPEVLALRELAPRPSDESVSRTWYRITQLSAAPAPRRRRWVPVTAAAAVLLLAAVSLTLVRVGPGTLWPVATTPDAIGVLDALAERAAAGAPAPVLKPGQLIYVEVTGWAAQLGVNGDVNHGLLEPQPRHLWVDPQGMMAVKITDGTTDLNAGPKGETLPRAERPPTGLLAPTPEWLAGLPAEPTKLLLLLRKQVAHNDRWSADHQLWDALAQLYSVADVVLTPQTRAALLRAATGMTGLSVRSVEPGVVAIRHTDGDSGVEILFDENTGHAIGRASVFLGTGVTFDRPAQAPVLDPDVGYQGTWTQTIVDSTAGS